MKKFLMRLFVKFLVPMWLVFSAPQANVTGGLMPPFLTPAIAQETSLRTDRPVEKMFVEEPSWDQGGGLLIVDLTVNNGNEYSVKNIIIACDLFDERGAQVGSPGTMIHRTFSPGRTRVSGIELQVKSCRVISAKRVLSERTPQS
jgi:hypothetical protein